MSLRGIYYSLPPIMRLYARKLVYGPLDLVSKRSYENGLPVPPRSLIYTGSGDFKETGLRFLEYFKKHGLQADHNILDVGSGIGRIALPLTSFLKANYLGLDIMPLGVNWCKEHISSQFPTFEFSLLDAKNDLYNSTGLDASTIKFPQRREEFDFCCLISVFTHMIPTEVDNYLSEINKSLKMGAKCFSTFFIYESEEELIHNNFKDFIAQDESYALMDERVVSANVAYSKKFLLSMFDKNGFKITYTSRGKWVDKNAIEDFQDYVILEKIRN